MSIFLDNIFSIYGSSINKGMNKNDDDNNIQVSINNIENINVKDEVLTYYNYLAKISVTINILLIYFSNGQFNELSLIFTLDLYNKLSSELNNIKYEKNKDYELIRKSFLLSIQGLQQCVNQYSNMVSLEQNNQYLTEQNAILRDGDKLNEYLNELLSEKSLFPPQSFSLIAATLRAEYAEYIRLYGFPEGGIFDMDKLAVILSNL